MNAFTVTSNLEKQLENVRIDTVLYYLAFLLYSIASGLSFTTVRSIGGFDISVFLSFAQVVSLCCLLFKFLSQRMDGPVWVFSAAVVAIGFASWRLSGENYFLWLVLFVISSFDTEYRTLARLALISSIFTISFSMISLKAGLARDVVVYGSNGLRHSMGFIHPNTFGRFLVVVAVAFSTAHFKTRPVIDLIVAALCAAIAYFITGSRTSVLLLLCLAALLVLFSLVKSAGAKKIVLSALFVITIILISSSFYFMLNYDYASPFQRSLDSLLSGRLSLAHAYVNLGPLTLFGRDYPEALLYGLPASFTVDNAWCHLLLRAGIVPTALLLLGEVTLLWRVVRAGRMDGFSLGLVLMMLYSVSETVGIMIETNFYLVAIAPVVLSGSYSLRQAWLRGSQKTIQDAGCDGNHVL